MGQGPDSKRLGRRKMILTQALSDTVPCESWAGRRFGIFWRDLGLSPGWEAGWHRRIQLELLAPSSVLSPYTMVSLSEIWVWPSMGAQHKVNASWAICDWSDSAAESEIVGGHRSYHVAREIKEMRGQSVPSIPSSFCPLWDRRKQS